MAAAVGVAALAAAAAPVVTVPGAGVLSGATALGVDSFLGIPYAAPPVRWQPPEPPAPWNGTRAATAFGATCIGSACGTMADSEDCLFLNVFRPARRPRSRLPVMVWIHGGSYTTGCSNIYGGWTLLNATRYPVVLVTINYRLGEFGFLGGREVQGQTRDGSSGNFGIQDQRMALRWVKEHIAAFGGDPELVTIFGESAGAGSVAAHLVSTQSWPLFSHAIMESGAGAVWNTKPLPLAEQAFTALANQTQCASTPSPVECLRRLSPRELQGAVRGMGGGAGSDGLRIQFSPVVDGVEFAESVRALAQRGHFKKTASVVLGTQRDEGAAFALEGVIQVAANGTEADFDRQAEQWLSSWGSPSAAALAELKRLYSAEVYNYPANRGNYSHWWWAAVRAATDMDFTCAHRRVARALVAQGATGVYSYHFVHPTQTRVAAVPGCGPGSVVVPHGSDCVYVFACVSTSPWPPRDFGDCPLTAPGEAELSAEMADAWARFATHGAPGTVGGTRWAARSAPVSTAAGILEFDVSLAAGGGGIRMGGPRADRQCDFWDRFVR